MIKPSALPLQAAAQPVLSYRSAPRLVYEAVVASKTGSVLIVEDEPELAELIQCELTRVGYATRLAPDGRQALQLVDQEIPDLMILDWFLPEVDGMQVLHQVRNTILQDVAVLVISARGAEKDRISTLEQGADDFLPKPFSLRELLARVEALLRRATRLQRSLTVVTGSRLPPMRHGDLLLDLHARSVFLSGRPLELTRSEFDLLVFMVRHPGCAFTRADLQETVWRQHHVPGDRSVDNVVLRLRRKLGSYAGNLETVWGLGYRLKLR